MIPAQTPLSKTAAVPPLRFTAIFVVHGMAPGYWIPEGPTLEPGKMKTVMQALDRVVDDNGKLIRESLLDKTTIISGLWAKSAEPPEGVTGADHWVASAYLCATKPKKATGADIQDAITLDQRIAAKIGQDSLVPSLQLAIEDPGANSSNCGEGYSCAYTNSISWAPSTPGSDFYKKFGPAASQSPLPMELNPQVTFERLFGDVQAKNADERAARREQDRSILDSVTQKLASFTKGLDASDRAKVNDWSDMFVKSSGGWKSPRSPQAAWWTGFQSRPACRKRSTNTSSSSLTCKDWRSRATLHVATVLYARDLTGRAYPASKVPSLSFHGGSHHAENPDRIAQYALLNQYHVGCMGYFADQLRNTPDGNGSLLDHSLILYGTNMGDSNQHLHYDVPHILVGGANGQLKGGRHIAFPSKTITTGNLMLSIAKMYGLQQDSIGDSTGILPNLV